ncbi:MAG: hypothetical protein JO257_32840 [Deltaproteobacteria bacterium]|nr:hypothetical protein [Deltaproteobacteria bacterium]
MRLFALVALAACGSSGPSNTVTVTALAGVQPAGGATVVSHAIDGTKLDQTAADAVGVAHIGYEKDALVTVLFPGQISPLTPNIEIVTAPLTDGMTIVGPSDAGGPATIVGGLQLSPKNINADRFEVQLGCATLNVAQMPAVVDVGARCMGSDQNVDVLITAYLSAMPVGYSAGRVQMVDGMATFAPPKWTTNYTTLPVTINDTNISATWTLVVDGLPFTTLLGEVPVGLMVDRLIVDAELDSNLRTTTRWYSMLPASVTLDTTDFLDPITASLAAGYTWTAAALGDAVDLRATWHTQTQNLQWDAILPPDATTVGVPPVDLPPPPTAMFELRYVDGPGDGFPATEIHADSVVPPTADGQIRVTEAIGLR